MKVSSLFEYAPNAIKATGMYVDLKRKAQSFFGKFVWSRLSVVWVLALLKNVKKQKKSLIFVKGELILLMLTKRYVKPAKKI